MNLSAWMRAVLDIIYPRYLECVICGQRLQKVDERGVCESCRVFLSLIKPPLCPRCGKPIDRPDRLCFDCERTQHYFKQAASVFEYDSQIRELIYRYKYKGEMYLADMMSEWMVEVVNKQCDWDFDVIIPVPLHPVRYRRRGFNQSELLAERIGAKTGRKVLTQILVRIKNTPTQTALDRQQRMQNLAGAFECKNAAPIEGKNILLVDDVYTTGSTVDQCSRVLLDAGARCVYVVTFATGRGTQV